MELQANTETDYYAKTALIKVTGCGKDSLGLVLSNVFATLAFFPGKYFSPWVFNVFQVMDPQSDEEMKWGPPTLYI